MSKNIPGFNQTVGEFSKKKSNYVGIGVIVFTGVAFFMGKISFNEAIYGFGFGSAVLAGRDTLAKIEKKTK